MLGIQTQVFLLAQRDETDASDKAGDGKMPTRKDPHCHSRAGDRWAEVLLQREDTGRGATVGCTSVSGQEPFTIAADD